MKQLFKFTALLMAVAMMVVACAAPETPANMAEDTVNVSFQSPEAKTTSVSSGSVDSVLISSVFFQYKAEYVSGINIGEVSEWTNLTSDEVSGLGHTLKLGRGVWNISLRGFATAAARTEAGTAETAGTKAIFDGELTSFSVGNGSTVLAVTADVPLEFTNNSGKGSCTVTVTFDEEYAGESNKKATVRLQSGEFDQTITLTFGETGTDASDVAEFTEVDNGIATITVDYLDENGTPYGDAGSATTLIMTDMHTTTTATISIAVVKFTINGIGPEGSAEDNFVPKVFNSLFDIYPDNITDLDNSIVIGYAEETKALEQTPITYPYVVNGFAMKDEKGRYNASSLGLTPIVVKSKSALSDSGATEAWWGKRVYLQGSSASNNTLRSVRFIDNTTTIMAYAFSYCKALSDVVIPDSVTSIGHQAFMDCSSLNSIELPNSITYIGSESFYGCGLKSLSLPNSVKEIDNGAFRSCKIENISIGSGVQKISDSAFSESTYLTEINVSEDNSYFKVQDGVLMSADGTTIIRYPANKEGTNYTIPNTVTKIYDNAFRLCKNLVSITISDSISSITGQVFRYCSFTSVNIGSGVTEIDPYAFSDCTNLTEINVSEDNSYFKSQDGVLMNADGTTIIRYPANKEGTSYTIPDGVTTIEKSAFSGCKNLTSMKIPNGVTSIGSSAFSSCDKLRSITIPESVTSIGSYAFSYAGLRSIYINQPESDTLFANASVPSSCTIHWNSTGPASV